MEQPLVVAIAGGTGAGKTTLANTFLEREPERYAVVRLDDYYKQKNELEPIDGIVNWERPEAIRYENLRGDLGALREGKTVTVATRLWKYNAEHQKVHEEHFEYTIEAKPVILVEGFLVLADPLLRDLFDMKIYLDIPIERSLERRLKMENKYNAPEYFEDVLIPAHKEFVESTKEYADLVVPVQDKSPEKVYEDVRAKIEEKLIA